MGRVYRARDTKLDRDVALKVLPDAFMADPDRLGRFEREAKVLASLNHPNVGSIYGLEETGDVQALVLELVEGPTLADRIAQGTIAINEALAIAKQIAEALEAAHDAGVIHRDLKPANIKVREDGTVKVLDFGLAKALDPAPKGGSQSPTRTGSGTEMGVILGTVAYMSPEQARGEALDRRTDLFSLGAVLYEMVTGRAAFDGGTPAVVFNAILSLTPPRPLSLNRDLPSKLDEIIIKSLEKDRGLRYQHASDLLADLKRLTRDTGATTSVGIAPSSPVEVPTREDETSAVTRAAQRAKRLSARAVTGVVSLGVVLSVAGYGLSRRVRNGREPITSVAVLPFENETGDAGLEYLSDGIAEGIISRLSRLSSLSKVAASASTRTYKNRDVDPGIVARELDVRAVLTGRMNEIGDRVTLYAELVDASDGSSVWSDRFTRTRTDILAIEEYFAGEIATALGLEITPDQEARFERRYTDSAEAHAAYLRGRFHWNRRTEDEVRQGLAYFQEALEHDPTYALAYAGLADTYNILGDYGYLAPGAAFPEAKAAATRALAIDEALAEAHTALGKAAHLYDWNWAASEQSFQRGIDLNPNYPSAHMWYAELMLTTGRAEDAVSLMRVAHTLDPLSSIINNNLGLSLYEAGRADEAIEQYQETIRLDPMFFRAHGDLGMVYAEQGRFDEAFTQLERAVGISRHPMILAGLGHAYAAAGRRDDALAQLEALERVAQERYVQPTIIAAVHAGLGDVETALDVLDEAHDMRDVWLTRALGGGLFGWFDEIRSQPRFQELLRRMDLSQP